MWAFTPDVFIDTIGHASTYPIAKYLFGCRTAAYVHYPTVSSDMIERVASGRLMYNNSARFTSSKMLTGLKILYYRAFAVVYRWCGKSCSCVMVNSTWTKGHIDELWGVDSRVVYPPCNVEDLSTLQLTRPRLSAKGQPVKKDKAALRVVSVGQFRPEKAHVMQLAAWKAMKKSKNRTQKMDNAVLVFVGSCRDDADRERDGGGTLFLCLPSATARPPASTNRVTRSASSATRSLVPPLNARAEVSSRSSGTSAPSFPSRAKKSHIVATASTSTRNTSVSPLLS